MTYLWTGYVITWIAVAAYAWRLGRRLSQARERLREVPERHGSTSRRG